MKNKRKTIVTNKKAYFDYNILETYEAGIELFGTEVKSIRESACNLKGSYIDIIDGEAYVIGMNITPYEKGNIFNKDPMRRKRLLLHKKEIRKLYQSVQQKGFSIVPLSLYFSGQKCKMEIALVTGKKLYEKREYLKKKDLERESVREIY